MFYNRILLLLLSKLKNKIKGDLEITDDVETADGLNYYFINIKNKLLRTDYQTFSIRKQVTNNVMFNFVELENKHYKN